MRVVLFLDFDGVTHPEPCFAENVFCRLPLIEGVLFEFPGVQIVISSSWRDHYSIEELRWNFSDGINQRVVDVTPSIMRPSPTWLAFQVPAYEREWEIETWMEENRHWGARWLAIDDRPHWFRPDSPNLLLTNAKTGFVAEDQDRLRAMLKGRR